MNTLLKEKEYRVKEFDHFNAPWKIWNELWRRLAYPWIRSLFAVNGITWKPGWRLYGVPIIQKHRASQMVFGLGLQLRSSPRSNPLSPYHPVILSTRQANALLKIGNNFGMTGGTICATDRIIIGNNVTVGANSTIIDTDFHPLEPQRRKEEPSKARYAPVLIEDDVFIGMNCLILKGVTIGEGAVIGAGSVVAKEIPPRAIMVGNPAHMIGVIG